MQFLVTLCSLLSAATLASTATVPVEKRFGPSGGVGDRWTVAHKNGPIFGGDICFSGYDDSLYYPTVKCDGGNVKGIDASICAACCKCDIKSGTGSCTNQKQFCGGFTNVKLNSACFGGGIIGGNGLCHCEKAVFA